MSERKSKIAILRASMAAGDWTSALRLAASFPRLGVQKEAITRGWNAIQHPAFYLEIGQDPNRLVEEAIGALQERYRVSREVN